MSNKPYRAAGYARLSKEDLNAKSGKGIESNSINTQKSMIEEFCKSNTEIELVKIYADDGYTGSNFSRPAFEEMMQDINSGRINCVVVKDFSRFGREYIDSGRYLEKTFPSSGVRFISIIDHYDSSNLSYGDSLTMPFKNIINDAYCRDISIKIRTSLESKRKNGYFVGPTCPFGYRKDPENKNKLLPDERTRSVVEKIFDSILMGKSLDKISQEMNDNNVPSPMETKLLFGDSCNCSFRTHEHALWSANAVRRIATNRIYIGDMVQGKRTTPSNKVHKVIAKPQSEWSVVNNTHEGIVDPADFDVVQHILSMDLRTAPGKDSLYLFSGLIYCSECKNPMVRKKTTIKGKSYVYYICNHKGCSSHRIREDKLYDKVLHSLKYLIQLTIDSKELILSNVGNGENTTIEREKLEKDREKYTARMAEAYDDKLEGLLNNEEFLMIKNGYLNRISQLNQMIAELNNRNTDRDEKIQCQIKRIEQYKNLQNLNRKTVVRFIRGVYINKTNEIEIQFNISDMIQNYLLGEQRNG